MEILGYTPNPDSHLYPAAKPEFILVIKFLAGISSCLSIVGACLIIFTYMFCGGPAPKKWERSVARQIIVMLSVADIIVAVSHIWGVSQHLERYLEPYLAPGEKPPVNDIECIVQAVLAVYGTLASFMWTWMLVFFLCCITTFQGVKVFDSVPAIVLYQALCWGAPLLLVIVLACNSLLGFGEGTDIGWCFVSLSLNETSIESRITTLIVGYEMWTWLLLVSIAVFSVGFLVVVYLQKNERCCFNNRHERIETTTDNERTLDDAHTPPVTPQARLLGKELSNSGEEEIAVRPDQPINKQTAGWKFALAAACLIFLRSFNTVVDIGLLISHQSYREVWVAVVVAFAAVGDSIQGFVNMLIFVIVTPQFYQLVKRARCGGRDIQDAG